MRKISEKLISDTVARLCRKANFHLRKDIETVLKRAVATEPEAQPKKILTQLLENSQIARKDEIALCQDTGLPVVFVDIGVDVDIRGIDIAKAINLGIETGYKKGFLRNSIVEDPLLRNSGSVYTPGVIHFNFKKQKGIKITVLPKGFGCENKTKLMMFEPTATQEEIKNFIVSVVKDAGPDACPPYIIGVGIGGTADYACQLSKEALLRPLDKRNKARHVALIEKDLLKRMNKLDIGPMGLGGKTTVLGVNILTYPTHIAGLPVCVNVSCHVLRSASETIK